MTSEHRKAKRRESQRKHRAGKKRLDYYPSAEARSIIDGLRTPYVSGTASAIINRIITEWTAAKTSEEPDASGDSTQYAHAREASGNIVRAHAHESQEKDTQTGTGA